ncbi:unnamed protein product, partial [Didymodactylos carnosus]
PSVYILWSEDEPLNKPIVTIEWQHISDRYVEEYILYVDDKDVKHVGVILHM